MEIVRGSGVWALRYVDLLAGRADYIPALQRLSTRAANTLTVIKSIHVDAATRHDFTT